MTEGISSRANLKTPMDFIDNSRPLVMTDADNIFKRLQFVHGSGSDDAIAMATQITDVLLSTSATELDQVWTKLEKRLNKGSSIPVKAKTDEGKISTIYSLLYSALNVVDQKAVSTNELAAMKNLFYDADLHFVSKFAGKMTGTDKRNALRVSKTLEARIKDMEETFNALLEEGKLVGNPL